MDAGLNEKFEKLITGKASYQSANLGCNLLIVRLQKKYSSNPTPEELSGAVKEMNAFFEKYASILTKDIENLKNL